VVLVDDAAVNVETARKHGWTGIHYVKGKGWQAAVTRPSSGPPVGRRPTADALLRWA
jgi:hypothetical protein